MRDSNTAKHFDLAEPLFGEFALAPYRVVLRCASMAHLGANATIKMNRALIDAYRQSIRAQQDAFTKLSTSILNCWSHDGGNPAETMGILSRSLRDVCRSATEGAAEFEQALVEVRDECLAGLRDGRERATAVPAEVAEKKAA